MRIIVNLNRSTLVVPSAAVLAKLVSVLGQCQEVELEKLPAGIKVDGSTYVHVIGDTVGFTTTNARSVITQDEFRRLEREAMATARRLLPETTD